MRRQKAGHTTRWRTGMVALVLLAGSGLARAEADCVPVWLDTRGQAAECGVVDAEAGVRQQERVCLASSQEKAVVRIRLTSCRQQVAAAAAPPGAAIAGREFVVRAQATEGEATKELLGLNGNSWAGAVRDLCRAVAVWHADLAKPE
jgi:hypothetical protein